jgi:hypothetical protein
VHRRDTHLTEIFTSPIHIIPILKIFTHKKNVPLEFNLFTSIMVNSHNMERNFSIINESLYYTESQSIRLNKSIRNFIRHMIMLKKNVIKILLAKSYKKFNLQ